MRNDAIGFFWCDDIPKPPKKEVVKRTPPAPTWLALDYLPGLEEALRFPVHTMSDAELFTAQRRGERLVNDDEVYGNYFLSMFTSLTTGHVAFVEAYGEQAAIDVPKLRWILENFGTVGFNSWNYDQVINGLALEGHSPENLKICSDKLIVERMRPTDVLKAGKAKRPKGDHVDLIEVAPLGGTEGGSSFAKTSLKTYYARMHGRKLQDLPFAPETILTPEQAAITRWYCVNDTHATAWLNEHLREHLDLRVQLGEQYGMDLRSKSDAQVAEAIISHEIKRVTGRRPARPKQGQSVGQVFRYRPPAYIEFATPELKRALATMSGIDITVGETGHAQCPKEFREHVVTIGGKKYTIGMGGLHSNEQSQAIVGGPNLRVIDRDVTGYYPNLILKNGFTPPQLGHTFLIALGGMVDQRTNAKVWVKEADDRGHSKTDIRYMFMVAVRDGMKIANNGVFGKLSDPFSVVYDVPNMVQVTITGQLSILMIIEALELAGIPVVSANTDGIVVACPADRYDDMCALFKAWERHTSLETEETEYRALYSANVNNYIAVKMDGKTKAKGWYSERGSAHNSVLSKNPENLICSDAAQAYLAKGIPVEQTIRACKDIRRFVSVRVVSGGGVKLWPHGSEYLGKTIRWYYSVDAPGEIVYARSGNRVSRTADGAKPMMELTDWIPNDINYDWYIANAEAILRKVGAWPAEAK